MNWVAGTPVPEWILEQSYFSVFLDERGDAWFQYNNGFGASVLLPRGELVEYANGVWTFDGWRYGDGDETPERGN